MFPYNTLYVLAHSDDILLRHRTKNGILLDLKERYWKDKDFVQDHRDKRRHSALPSSVSQGFGSRKSLGDCTHSRDFFHFPQGSSVSDFAER